MAYNYFEKLYLLEFSVHQVCYDCAESMDENFLKSLGPTSVTLVPNNLPAISVSEEEFGNAGPFDSYNVKFTSGKSCLFALKRGAAKCVSDKVRISVSRRLPTPLRTKWGSDFKFGTAYLRLRPEFLSVLSSTCSANKELTVSLDLLDCKMAVIGSIAIFLRLTGFGLSIITHFQSDPDNTFSFKGDDVMTFGFDNNSCPSVVATERSCSSDFPNKNVQEAYSNPEFNGCSHIAPSCSLSCPSQIQTQTICEPNIRENALPMSCSVPVMFPRTGIPRNNMCRHPGNNRQSTNRGGYQRPCDEPYQRMSRQVGRCPPVMGPPQNFDANGAQMFAGGGEGYTPCFPPFNVNNGNYSPMEIPQFALNNPQGNMGHTNMNNDQRMVEYAVRPNPPFRNSVAMPPPIEQGVSPFPPCFVRNPAAMPQPIEQGVSRFPPYFNRTSPGTISQNNPQSLNCACSENVLNKPFRFAPAMNAPPGYNNNQCQMFY